MYSVFFKKDSKLIEILVHEEWSNGIPEKVGGHQPFLNKKIMNNIWQLFTIIR